ncbi:MAG TPA: septation protein SepH [Streptosporangiaceae bacterium]|nr:septation protein SepH [Streptosporangiaceae bacterium]
MQELRLVAVSEDGSYAVLVVPGRSGRFALPIDERLRTVARGQFSRLAQYEIEVESPLRPKEIQDRIRAGETAEEIADAAGLPVDRIRRFEGPVLAEREFKAKEAQRATVRSRGEGGPGPRLGEIVTERLSDSGANTDEVDWDSRKRPDGNWQVQLAYTVAGRMHLAEWVYDPRSKHVTPDDDEAVRLCLSEAEWPEPRPAARAGVTATVTPIGSRASSAGAHQADQRSQPDRPGGRGALHPSRHMPAGVAVASSGQHQVAAQTRAAGQAADRAPGSGTGTAPAVVGRDDRDLRDLRDGRDDRDLQDLRDGRDDRDGRDGRESLVAGAAEAEDDGRELAPAASADGAVAAVAASAGGASGAVGAGQPDGASKAAAKPAAAAAVAGDAAAAPAARPARRASGGRSRRSSVPSWDEIMFGNSRQPD